jgi:hypothetical protein
MALGAAMIIQVEVSPDLATQLPPPPHVDDRDEQSKMRREQNDGAARASPVPESDLWRLRLPLYRAAAPPPQVVNRAPIPHRAMHFHPIRHRSCDEPTVASS